ncbi:LytTR family transcriptional regulator DNA-binding domain-containing protein [Saccharibacillus sp. CPCC 101409]|uniref:LytR/AlgR family response regulator transcription factor n=1 Tax=Saccharibacillus sp. CPCC 101409 TaxID=3058041 RepID=UPI002671340A|nr:LytTR family DNA-binding domain-containing protein [Saccharibacillus sp. CPCC 101409]MDO3408211.1 LytTR family transcriptional regulator DNA-binding domain-containing protein [Saccharibacillus sp. CPCC 101409]
MQEIEENSLLKVGAAIGNAFELRQLLRERRDFSALLLDTGIDGSFVSPEWETAARNIPVILLASSLPYHPYTGGLNVVEFIQKPLTPFKIQQAELRLRRYLGNPAAQSSRKSEIPVVNEEIVYLDSSDVLFIESLNRDVIVHTRQGRFSTRISLKAYRNSLQNESFMMTHRSFLVNLPHAVRIDGEDLFFEDYAQPALISSEKKAEVLRELAHYAPRNRIVQI